MEIRTGCSGWSYRKWVGPFYPKNTDPHDYLREYSKVFDTVEIDSTFYRIPDEKIVGYWRDSTPDSFIFTAKMPKSITHDARLRGVKNEAEKFINAMSVLGRKLGAVVIQLPPSLSYTEAFTRLTIFLDSLPQDIKFAVEFRHNSWSREDVFQMLKERGVTLAWSEVPMSQVNPALTSDLIYLRLVGDRSIPDFMLGTVVREKKKEIEYWAGEVSRNKDYVRKAYIFANNHFQGFGPETVNEFRKVVGMEKIEWRKNGQTKLLRYL